MTVCLHRTRCQDGFSAFAWYVDAISFIWAGICKKYVNNSSRFKNHK